MRAGEVFGSFLSKDDLGGREVAVTVESVSMAKVMNDGKEVEKPAMKFVGKSKSLIFGPVVWQQMQDITGQDDSDAWVVKIVTLYVDPSVSFGGKHVGGIRIKGDNGAASSPVQAAPPLAQSQNPAPAIHSGPLQTEDPPF